MNSGAEYGNANKIRYEDIERGYRTIGCHYVICNGRVYRTDTYDENVKDGAVEVGRPVSMAGSHTRGANIDSIGIVLIGKRDFTNKQELALLELVNELCDKHKIEKSNVFEKNHFDKNFHKLNITDIKKIIG